jgi:cytoskeletal protein RodZ
MSIEDVAADTRIRATLIRAIEADDFSLCGGAVYARGHIRSIARFLGIDAAPLIAEFDAANQVERPTVPEVATEQIDLSVDTHIPWSSRLPQVPRSPGGDPTKVIAAIAAVVVVLAIGLSVALLGHSGGGQKAPLATTQSSTSPHTTPTTHSSTPPASTGGSTQAARRATMLVRTVDGKTWLSIKTKTGKTLFEGVLNAGEHKVFTSRHGLAFIIGNAPAVDVVVNGHDIGPPPSSGNVSRGNVEPGADTVHQA